MQLVINTLGASLRRSGDRFSIQAGPKQLAVSAHKVQSILVTTGVLISSDAIELASEHNIDLVFLNKFGEPFSRVWQTKMGSTAAIRRRQLEVADTPEGLGFVRDWVQAKVRNQLEFLDELARRRPEATDIFQNPAATLRECLGTLGPAERQRGRPTRHRHGPGRNRRTRLLHVPESTRARSLPLRWPQPPSRQG